MAGGQPGRYASPLRYPGGKGKVANYFKLLLLENDMLGTDYVEVYAGGASVALELLYEEYVDQVQINDLNAGVHAFWQAAVTSTDELCELVRTTPVTMDTWLAQREVVRLADVSEPLQLAFATFFLNRTNRSGIVSGGGVIGGLDQTGPYKIDARYNTDELIRRIRKVGRYRDRIVVSRHDAVHLLQELAAVDQQALVYLDPPYFLKGQDLYDNFYAAADHQTVADEVLRLRHSWVVSYDAAPEILKMYASVRDLHYGLAYTAHKRQDGSEVMFFSEDLHIPDEAPASLPMARVHQAQQPSLFAPR